MINTNRKNLTSIAVVLAGVYILLDALLLLSNFATFGNASITMLAGDVFGIFASVMILVIVLGKNEIKYSFLSFVPLILGIGEIVMMLPAVINIGFAQAGGDYLTHWGTLALGGILYIIVSALYYAKKLSPKIVAAAYLAPLIYNLGTGGNGFSGFSSLPGNVPSSIKIFMLVSRLSSVKGALLVAAIVLLTLSYDTVSAPQTAKSKATVQGVFVKSESITTIVSVAAILLAALLVVLTLRYYTGYTELFWYEAKYKWIAKIFSLIRALCQASVGAVGLYAVQSVKNGAPQSPVRAVPISAAVIAGSEACYVFMTIFTMLESDGEGLGDLLLMFWIPAALIFTAVVFTLSIIFSFKLPAVSVLIVAAYYAVQLTVGHSNYFGVYPSKMYTAEIIEVVLVLLALYFTAGLVKTPKTQRISPDPNTTVYYNPTNNND